MNNLAFATIKELRALLEQEKITPQELLNSCIERFKKYDKDLGSALEVFDAGSILEKAGSKGTLAGIPGLIKDNIALNGRIQSCGSKMLKNFHAVHDATAIKRLRKEGALLMGRANMDEFAMGSSGETSAFFKTKNPWDTTRVPGGSSSGSAAAVAAGLAPWALGTDTGGSVRQPAAFCGIVGLKPTYGLVSRYGVVAYGSSLDQIGTLTRTVEDSAIVLSAIAGNDLKDSTSLRISKKDYTQRLTGTLKEDLKIGIIEDALKADGMDPEVVDAVETSLKKLELLGAKIHRVQLPQLDYSAAAYFILSRAEAASNLARFDGVRYGMRNKEAQALADMYSETRHDGFGTEVKARIIVGNYALSAGHADAFYEHAKMVQRSIRRGFAELFKKVDVLVMPTQPAPAFKFGAFDVDKLQMDLQDYFTCPANLAGIPGISVPCGMSSQGLPIGMQFFGPHLSEGLLLQTAHAYEQVTEWHKMNPPGFE